MKVIRGLLALTLWSAFLVGCESMGVGTESQSLTDNRTPFVAFEAYWPQRGVDELSTRLNAVAAVILGTGNFDKAPLSDAVRRHDGEKSPWTDDAMVGGAKLHVEYIGPRDDLRISDLALEDDTSSTEDIGFDGARSVITKAIATLEQAGLLKASDFDAQNAEIVELMHGEGNSSETISPKVAQYRCTLRRRIRGIESLNSGLRISVHRTGRMIRS